MSTVFRVWLCYDSTVQAAGQVEPWEAAGRTYTFMWGRHTWTNDVCSFIHYPMKPKREYVYYPGSNICTASASSPTAPSLQWRPWHVLLAMMHLR